MRSLRSSNAATINGTSLEPNSCRTPVTVAGYGVSKTIEQMARLLPTWKSRDGYDLSRNAFEEASTQQLNGCGGAAVSLRLWLCSALKTSTIITEPRLKAAVGRIFTQTR